MRANLLFVFVAISVVNGEIFTSTARLQSLMNLERHLVSEMTDFLSRMESSLYSIQRYLNEFSETVGRPELATDEIVGNPLHAFQLVKRLSVNWRKIDDTMKKENYWKGIENLTTAYESLMPNKDDLNGAALALVRLQDTYHLNMSDLANGQLDGYQTHVEMTARDCLYLGNNSLNNGYYGLSVEWFKEAMSRANREHNTTASVEEILPFYTMAVEKHDSLATNQNYTQYMTDSKGQTSPNTKLKMVKGEDEDYHKYQALCRGESLRSPKEEQNLKCYISNRGHPFLVLQPVGIEVFNEKPLVMMYHNLMSDYEMDIYRQLATPMLIPLRIPTKTHNGEVYNRTSPGKTSQSARLFDSKHKVVQNINRRVEAVTGLSADLDQSHLELKITNYGIGGHLVPHIDYTAVDWHLVPEERRLAKDLAAFYRTATLMFYLSTVVKGGSTVFPRLGAKVVPEKGSAVFWYNVYRNGEGIRESKHGGCPVLMGEKWVSNYWFRELGQTFRRKCSLDPNE